VASCCRWCCIHTCFLREHMWADHSSRFDLNEAANRTRFQRGSQSHTTYRYRPVDDTGDVDHGDVDRPDIRLQQAINHNTEHACLKAQACLRACMRIWPRPYEHTGLVSAM